MFQSKKQYYFKKLWDVIENCNFIKKNWDLKKDAHNELTKLRINIDEIMKEI